MEGSTPSGYQGLLGALEWMLPDPVTPSQVFVGNDGSVGSAGAPAAILLGDEGRAVLRRSFPCTREIRAFSNARSPRFLYPADASFDRFTALLRPRSGALRKVVISRALSMVPKVIEFGSSHVAVATKSESALSLLVDEYSQWSMTAINVGYRDGLPRPTIWGFDQQGSIRVIAKYASGDTENLSLHNEYQILKSLNELPRFVGRVPAAYAYRRSHLGSMLVTNAFQGAPGPLEINVQIHDWLASCVVGPRITALHSPLLHTLESDALRCGGTARTASRLAKSELEGTTVPLTVVHGDFAPWNLLLDEGTVRVFDWETAQLFGIPEWDRIFYMVRVGMIVKGWRRDQLIDSMRTLESQGSSYYRASEWKAVLILSLVNLLMLESRSGSGGVSANMLESSLSHLVSQWWQS